MVAYKILKFFGVIRPMKSVPTWELIKELEQRGYGAYILKGEIHIIKSL